LVRHRLTSVSQKSTRYCNYNQDKFGNELTFIEPNWLSLLSQEERNASNKYIHWYNFLMHCESVYFRLLNSKMSPQEARGILPNDLETELVMTSNLREWRHILKLRTSNAAHPDMREIMIPLLNELNSKIPIIFEDIRVK